MIFYPSKNHDRLNGVPFLPEQVTGRAMLNPHHKTTVEADTRVIWDSGAFQERDMHDRLAPAQALDRQLAVEARTRGLWRGHAEALVTYDMLVGVDEAIEDGRRVKRRGTEETARPAIAATLESAAYYASQRHRIAGAIAFAAQGATPRQYVDECVVPLLDLMTERDWLAFGGFCIIGMQPRLKPLFAATVARTLPLLRRKGIRRAHILGVTVHDALQVAAAEGRKHGVELSTDSSSIEMNSIHGRVWHESHMAGGRSPWRSVFGKEAKVTQDRIPGPREYHPRDLAHANILRFAKWAETLGAPPPGQQHLFGVDHAG